MSAKTYAAPSANVVFPLDAKGYSLSIGSGFALNIALVAAGSYDTFIAYGRPSGDGPNTWDLAGGLALCKTAGVEVRHLDGKHFRLHDKIREGMVFAWPDTLEHLTRDFDGYRPLG